MTEELQYKIQELFKRCICNPNEIYPSNWKYIVLKLQTISNLGTKPFSDDARSGFNYLGAVIYNTICDKCHDKKAFIWLKEFAQAWLDKEELPKFPTSCFFNEGEYLT